MQIGGRTRAAFGRGIVGVKTRRRIKWGEDKSSLWQGDCWGEDPPPHQVGGGQEQPLAGGLLG
jgi:hypothetical protein